MIEDDTANLSQVVDDTAGAAGVAMAAPAAEVVIQCSGLTKVFRDFWLRNRVVAVGGIDLAVRRGQVYGLLGPNGSGKSTTIKLILGLLYPSAGRVSVFGKRPDVVATKKLIGYLPEDSYLHRFLNARETLDYYGRLFHLPRQQRRQRIDMLLEMVGLEAVQRRPVGEYSKGMQRRIGLAQALINDPQLLILDEPTNGLDPIGTRQIKDLIQELAHRGKTVLMCSHLLADVEDVCDYVSIMYGGKVRTQGTVDELLVRQDLTTIQTPRLEPEMVEAIDWMLRIHDSHIDKVEQPREKLEALFLDIVHRAQADAVPSHGAGTGGQIAGFLTQEQVPAGVTPPSGEGPTGSGVLPESVQMVPLDDAAASGEQEAEAGPVPQEESHEGAGGQVLEGAQSAPQHDELSPEHEQPTASESPTNLKKSQAYQSMLIAQLMRPEDKGESGDTLDGEAPGSPTEEPGALPELVADEWQQNPAPSVPEPQATDEPAKKRRGQTKRPRGRKATKKKRKNEPTSDRGHGQNEVAQTAADLTDRLGIDTAPAHGDGAEPVTAEAEAGAGVGEQGAPQGETGLTGRDRGLGLHEVDERVPEPTITGGDTADTGAAPLKADWGEAIEAEAPIGDTDESPFQGFQEAIQTVPEYVPEEGEGEQDQPGTGTEQEDQDGEDQADPQGRSGRLADLEPTDPEVIKTHARPNAKGQENRGGDPGGSR